VLYHNGEEFCRGVSQHFGQEGMGLHCMVYNSHTVVFEGL
jgi:hypothetical protein